MTFIDHEMVSCTKCGKGNFRVAIAEPFDDGGTVYDRVYEYITEEKCDCSCSYILFLPVVICLNCNHQQVLDFIGDTDSQHMALGWPLMGD